MPEGPNPEPSVTVGEATRIVEKARAEGIPIRIFAAEQGVPGHPQ